MPTANSINNQKNVFISVGDPSADEHAARVLAYYQQHHSDITFIGMGGQQMQAAGLRCYVDAANLAVIGFTEVLKKVFVYRRALKTLRAAMKSERPDLLICVDFAAFNLRLARTAKRLGIPVLYYICPQVWASRRYRLRLMKKLISRIAVIFPFEKTFYQQAGMTASYVGHPLLPKLRQFEQCAESVSLAIDQRQHPIIGLLPGSRQGEIERLMPVLMQTVQRLQQTYPEAQFCLAKADSISEQQLQPYLQGTPVKLITGALYPMIESCDALICASGSVTLEVSLLLKPYVIIYKVNRLTAWLVRRLIQLPYIGISNIIAGKAIIPECLQENCTADKIFAEISKILQDESYRQQMQQQLQAIRQQLDADQADCTIEDLINQLLLLPEG